MVIWLVFGEDLLRQEHPVAAEALVVEGWIGIAAVREAKNEFIRGNYHYIVTAGGSTDNRWGGQRWNYAQLAAEQLVRQGVPAGRIIEARAVDTPGQRTYTMACGVRDALAQHDVKVTSINVFTSGVHARRSRLLFSRVLGPSVEVGSVVYLAPGELSSAWWESSDRAQDFLKETFAYPLELLFWSGRFLITNATSSRMQNSKFRRIGPGWQIATDTYRLNHRT